MRRPGPNLEADRSRDQIKPFSCKNEAATSSTVRASTSSGRRR
jgi:hypothetical protein